MRFAWVPVRVMALQREREAQAGDAQSQARHDSLMDEFWARHERALRAICTEEREKLRAVRIDIGLECFRNGEFETPDEDVLQSAANRAESLEQLAESALTFLAKLENATLEQIGTEFPLDGQSYLEWLTRMRAQRGEHLRNLPLD